MNWQASVSILGYPGVLSYIGKGVAFTLVLSVLAVVISILLGSVLALCRNYCTGKSRIFQWISTVYLPGGLPLPQVLRPENVGADQRGNENSLPGGGGAGAL